MRRQECHCTQRTVPPQRVFARISVEPERELILRGLESSELEAAVGIRRARDAARRFLVACAQVCEHADVGERSIAGPVPKCAAVTRSVSGNAQSESVRRILGNAEVPTTRLVALNFDRADSELDLDRHRAVGLDIDPLAMLAVRISRTPSGDI